MRDSSGHDSGYSRYSRRSVERNRRAHDRIVDSYDARHGEIFNPVEQGRLRAALHEAVLLARPDGGALRALDFGSGTGNLTRHLLDFGCTVTAADVSPRCLDAVRARYGGTGRIRTLRLNGVDLRELPDASFDLAASYSVLHHVDDYLGIVRELARVIRPGGVVYLDHEVPDHFWSPKPAYESFLAELAPPRERVRARLLDREWYRWQAKYRLDPRRWFNSRYSPEGDIHIWPDDHIEWGKVEHVLEGAGCDVIGRSDYLVFRSHYPPALYERYRDACSDMRLLVAQKRGGSVSERTGALWGGHP